MQDKKVIRVSSGTPVSNLAGSIVISVENGENVELRAIGASAVNQMFKAVALSRGTLTTKGKELLIRAEFGKSSEGENEEARTVMVAKLVIIE